MRFYPISLLLLFSILYLSSCIKDPLDKEPNNSLNAKELSKIDSPTTLSNHRDGVDYIVKSRADIRNDLTIEPGVEIQFESGAYLSIYSNGSINAIGTATKMIVMTKAANNFSGWPGIYISSESGNNIIEHCLVEYAGDGESFGTLNKERAAITLDGGRLRINNTIIQKSNGSGFVTVSSIGDCTISSFKNNRFIENDGFPIFVNQDYLTSMDLYSCVFTDNKKNMIGINGIHGDRLHQTSTWKNLGIPFYINDGIELLAGLTIEAGTEVIFANNAYLKVVGYSGNPYLTIQGTQSNHVILRGEEAYPKFWKGVRIDQSNAKNILEYTDISDGGSDADYAANIVLYNENTNLTINNCTSARSGGCDVILDDFLGVPVLTNNSPEITNVCEQ